MKKAQFGNGHGIVWGGLFYALGVFVLTGRWFFVADGHPNPRFYLLAMILLSGGIIVGNSLALALGLRKPRIIRLGYSASFAFGILAATILHYFAESLLVNSVSHGYRLFDVVTFFLVAGIVSTMALLLWSGWYRILHEKRISSHKIDLSNER